MLLNKSFIEYVLCLVVKCCWQHPDNLLLNQGGGIYSESSRLMVTGCEIHSNSAVRHFLFIFIYDTFIYVVHRHYVNSSSLRLKSSTKFPIIILLGLRRDNHGGACRVLLIVVFRAYNPASRKGCKFQ